MRLLAIALFCLFSLSLFAETTEQAEIDLQRRQALWQEEQQQRLIASYITNFPVYVTWPESVFEGHPDEIYIGFMPPNALQAGQQYLQGRMVRDRIYVVEGVKEQTSLDDLRRYQILFIDGLTDKKIKGLLKKLKGEPILTVGTSVNFLDDGGMIQFNVSSTGGVSFEVRKQNTDKAGITFQPDLILYGHTM